jgi:DNA repair protein RadC
MVTSTSDTGYHATVRELPNEERPRERLERYGAAVLTNPELLAIILRVGVQGENVIELSSRLLRKYGGLGGLLGAELDVLRAERGLGAAKAITLKAALEVGRRLTLLDSTERPQILGPGDVATLLALDLGFQSQEQLRVLCLDQKSHVVAQHTIYQGTVNASVVRAAEVFRPAVSRNCPAVIVVHNHPSGDPIPSPEDIRTTEHLRRAGEALDIELLDHVILSQQRYVSLKERGLGF